MTFEHRTGTTSTDNPVHTDTDGNWEITLPKHPRTTNQHELGVIYRDADIDAPLSEKEIVASIEEIHTGDKTVTVTGTINTINSDGLGAVVGEICTDPQMIDETHDWIVELVDWIYDNL